MGADETLPEFEQTIGAGAPMSLAAGIVLLLLLIIDVERIPGSALGPVCSIILITGAGGMFGGVPRMSGIGAALSNALSDIGLPIFVAGFLVRTALRVVKAREPSLRSPARPSLLL